MAVLLGGVASAALGRVARVNAGRTAVATGDRRRPIQYKPSRVPLEFFFTVLLKSKQTWGILQYILTLEWFD